MNEEIRSSSDEMSQSQRPIGWWEYLRWLATVDLLAGVKARWPHYRQLIAEAAFPAPIAALIETVVRRTRLWRSEKRDVSRELINHFREGLDRGTTAEVLVDHFGSIPMTARLIRRAKIRQRPVWWRTWYAATRSLALALGIILIFYSIQATRLLDSRSTIDRNYLAELNAPIRAIPIEERAWPLYVEAMRTLPALPAGLSFDLLDPSSPRWPEIAVIVRANKDRIAALRVAAAKPQLGLIIGDPNDPTFQMTDAELLRFGIPSADTSRLEPANPQIDTPSLRFDTPSLWFYSILDIASYLLAFSAQQSAAEGNGTECTSDLIAQIRLGNQCFTGRPFSIEKGFAIFSYMRACNNVRQILTQHPGLLRSDQLRELLHELQLFNEGAPIFFSQDSELLGWSDLFQRTYTSGPHGHLSLDGWELWRHTPIFRATYSFPRIGDDESLHDDFWAPISMTIAMNRQVAEEQIAEVYRRIDKNVATPPWRREEISREELVGPLQTRVMGFPRNPVGLFASNCIWIEVRDIDTSVITQNTTLTALALNLFKVENGRWPDHLDELVPKYLKSIPLDPNDGQPLRYKLTATGPLLYSIGPDHHDDGGRPMAKISTSPWRLSTFEVTSKAEAAKIHANPDDPQNGDWILWPPADKEEAKP